MSALICNALTGPISKYQDSKLNKQADNLLVNFNNEIKKYNYSDSAKKLETLLEKNKGQVVTSELFEQIHSNLSEGLDHVVAGDLAKDLKSMMPSSDKFNFSEESLENVRNVLNEHFSTVGLSKQELAQILPDDSLMLQAFKDKGLFSAEVSDFSEHSKLVQDLLAQRIEEFQKANPDSPISRKLGFRMNQLIHNNEHNANSALQNAFKFKPAAVLTDSLISTIRSAGAILNQFKAQVNVLDNFAFIKTAQAPETILANSWNDMSAELLKAFNFNPKEIKKARIDREAAGTILREKMEYIASDDKRYSEFVDSIVSKLSELYAKMESLDTSNEYNTNSYVEKVNSTYDGASEGLKNLNMHSTARSIGGFADGDVRTSAKHVQLSFVTDRISGVKSSFYRMLNAMDVYRRISTIAENGSTVLSDTVTRQAKEELVELAKQVLVDAHTSDYAVKFWSQRYPEVNPPANLSEQELAKFYSQIEVAQGKVVNAFMGTQNPSDLVELSNDRTFFSNLMKFMYEEKPHANTIERGGNSVIWDDFMKFRDEVLRYLGGDDNFAKPNHLVEGIGKVQSSSERRFLRMGCALDEMMYKLCKQKFNSNTWFKMFGGLGAGLFGVTVLSQFFLGRMKNPEPIKEIK
ncbi:hypothetical protein HDR58_02750, partial [bacterium]|nr:hypothetical protein [bacterium]